MFRGKFLEGLQQAHASGQLQFDGMIRGLSEPKLFRRFIRQLFMHRWVVYCKPPFRGPEQVLRYLGAYTHRVALFGCANSMAPTTDGLGLFRLMGIAGTSADAFSAKP